MGTWLACLNLLNKVTSWGTSSASSRATTVKKIPIFNRYFGQTVENNSLIHIWSGSGRTLGTTGRELIDFAFCIDVLSFFIPPFHLTAGSAGSRRWSGLARWRLRELNELQHYAAHRYGCVFRVTMSVLRTCYPMKQNLCPTQPTGAGCVGSVVVSKIEEVELVTDFPANFIPCCKYRCREIVYNCRCRGVGVQEYSVEV